MNWIEILVENLIKLGWLIGLLITMIMIAGGIVGFIQNYWTKYICSFLLIFGFILFMIITTTMKYYGVMD